MQSADVFGGAVAVHLDGHHIRLVGGRLAVLVVELQLLLLVLLELQQLLARHVHRRPGYLRVEYLGRGVVRSPLPLLMLPMFEKEFIRLRGRCTARGTSLSVEHSSLYVESLCGIRGRTCLPGFDVCAGMKTFLGGSTPAAAPR